MNEADFRKCAFDFPFFAKNYLRIYHPKRGLIPFDTLPYHERMFNAYMDHKFNIMKKFRQGGFSTATLLWLMWKCMFQFDQHVLYVSRTDREAVNAAKIVENAIRNLPDWLKPVMGKDNAHEKQFLDTGSHMHFMSMQASCGRATTWLFIDEAAFIPKMREHWQAVYPMLSCGGHAIVLSIPNGRGNWFEETYTGAEEHKNNFNIITNSYLEHPDYQNPEWARETMKQLGLRGWAQEVLALFD